MIKEMFTPNNKYKISIDNFTVERNEFELSIVKYSKNCTLFRGITDTAKQYGKVHCAVTDNCIYVRKIELNTEKVKEKEKFHKEAASTIAAVLEEVKKENNFREVILERE